MLLKKYKKFISFLKLYNHQIHYASYNLTQLITANLQKNEENDLFYDDLEYK